jgi:integrase/recombinase XerD
MGKLRDQMKLDLQVRNRSDGTIREYLRCAYKLAAFNMISPSVMTAEHVRAYFKYLIEERKLGAGCLKTYVGSVMFLFRITLSKPEVVSFLAWPRQPKVLPEILAAQEIVALIEAADSLRTRCWLMLGYGAGLRISEVCSLQFGDIDRARGVIHVHQGKGSKDRLVPLSRILLDTLVEYWRTYRPEGRFFPSNVPGKTITPGAVRTHFNKAKTKAGIRKPVTFHSLRRSFATHQVEAGVDLATIQAMLGHSDLATSLLYIRVQADHLRAAGSPLDRLLLPLKDGKTE